MKPNEDLRGIRRFLRSFAWAARGVFFDLPRQLNARVQAVVALVAVVLGVLIGFNRIEWCILILSIALVLGLEAMNTAIESVVDLVSTERSERARRAKDLAAGAVFIASVGAAFIGLILFVPKLLSLFER